MPLSNYAFDHYVSQNITQLTECNAIDLSQMFEQSDYWINNFVLNSIFRVQVKQEYKPFIFAILRRAQMALIEYEDGRRALQDYVKGDKNRISAYFKALYHFEITVSLTYQAYEYCMKITKEHLFKKGDGSPLERLNRISDVSKHLEPSTIPDSHLHAVWLSNKGICISTAILNYGELSNIIIDVCGLAEKLSNIPVTQKKDDNSGKEMPQNQSEGKPIPKGHYVNLTCKDTIAPGNDPCPPKDKEH